MCTCVCAPMHLSRRQLSPFTQWVTGMQFMLSNSAANTCTHWAILLAADVILLNVSDYLFIVKKSLYLSPLWILNASGPQVWTLPVCIDTVDSELRKLKRGVEGFCSNLDDNRIDRNSNSLNDFFSKAIFTGKQSKNKIKKKKTLKVIAGTFTQPHIQHPNI